MVWTPIFSLGCRKATGIKIPTRTQKGCSLFETLCHLCTLKNCMTVEQVDPITVVAGHERLTSKFGRWPSFHDAEVVDLHLWRGEVKPGEWDDSNVFPVLTVKLRILEATQIGATDAGHDVLATLRFHDVDDLKLEGFNHVNQIVELSLSIQPRGAFTDGSPLPPYIVVEFKAVLE